TIKERESQKFVENKNVLSISGGGWVVDDLVRRISFSFQQVASETAVEKNTLNKGPELITLKQPLTPFFTATGIEPFNAITKITPFDSKWERTIEIQPAKGKAMDSKQRMTLLTPYCACVESSRFRWQMMYLTRELGPETVRQLLFSHPDLKEREGEVDSLKR